MKFPSDEELEKAYGDLFDNADITEISNWKEPNTDIATSEEELLNNGLKKVDAYKLKVKEVIDNWNE